MSILYIKANNLRELEEICKGGKPGHDFHGNQHHDNEGKPHKKADAATHADGSGHSANTHAQAPVSSVVALAQGASKSGQK